MKKNQKTKQYEAPMSTATKNMLNIITPSGLQFTSTYTNIGENKGKIFAISRYPSQVDYCWMADLCNLEGTSTVVEYTSTMSDNLIRSYDTQIKNLKGEMGTAKNESERQSIENAIKDIKKMISMIKDEPIGYVNIMLLVQDVNERKLEERVRKVKSKIAALGASARILTFKQKEAYECMTPYGIPNEMVANAGNRNMPLSTFLGGFPMASTCINDDDGFYLGKTKKGRLTYLNIWKRGSDRVNSNWWIQGMPGVGKSSAIKLVLLMEWTLGSKIIIMDPEREYIDMANKIGGKVVDCIGGKNGRINPLQIRKSPSLDQEDIQNSKEMGIEYKDEGNGINDMALHIQNLRLFFRLYLPEISEIQMAYLEKSLIQVYNNFGITWETDIYTLNNEDYPIIRDLADYVLEQSKNNELTERDRTIYQELNDWFYSCRDGADQFIWNGATTLVADNDFIVLDTSGLIDTDDNIKNAQYMNICTWMWQQIADNRDEKLLVGIDEGYTVVDPDLPYVIKYIYNMSKRVRKYMSGLLFITHAPTDVLDPRVKRYGQAIIDNACYKLLMGCDGKNLEETVNLFNLTAKEENLLGAKQRGQAILYAGSTRVSINIDIKEEYLAIMGKAGGN